MLMQDIKSLNFEPLRAVYPELANMGGYAEHYAHTDPESAMVKLRNFAERLVDRLYLKLRLQRVSDWLKNLINQVQTPVILAGLPRSIAVVNANPQLRRRFGAPHYMQPFSFDTEDEILEFRGVLHSIQSRLPVPCVSLSENNMARRFYYGNLVGGGSWVTACLRIVICMCGALSKHGHWRDFVRISVKPRTYV